MPSIVTDIALQALDISIPECAKNRNARIVWDDNTTNTETRFQCRCGRKYQCLSSFLLRCSEHTDARSLVEPYVVTQISEGEPLMSVKKVRKRIQIVESGKIKFECPECNVWFTERYKYNDHMECHASPLARCCQVCKTQFSSGIRARKHIAKFHPELHKQCEEERRKSKEEYKRWNPPKCQKQKRKRKEKEEKAVEDTGGHISETDELQENDAAQIPDDEVYEDIEHLDPDFLDEVNDVSKSPENEQIVNDGIVKEKDEKKPKTTKPYKKGRRKRRVIGEDEYRMPSREQKECPICKTFNWPCNMKKHIMKHNAYENDSTCLKCGTETTKMKQHVKSEHGMDWLELIQEETKKRAHDGVLSIPYCEICFTPFKIKEHLGVHNDIMHGNQRNYQRTSTECRVCHKVFYNATNRRLHEERMHYNEEIPVGDDEYICDWCLATFQYKGHLVQHFKKHLTPCEYSETTKRKYFVAARQSTVAKMGAKKRYRSEFLQGPNDTVEMIFFCVICEAQFKTKNAVQDHVKLEHPRGNRNFICEHCGFITDAKYNLLIHLNTNHNISIPELEKTKAGRKAADARPCTCKFCGQDFTSIVKCKAHEKYHEKIRDDIVCPICGVKLRTQAYLKDHLKRHQEKNIACPYSGCDQKFVVRQNLQLHIKRAHLQAEIFKCRYCTNVYRSWNGRCYHEFKFHDGTKWRGHYKVSNDDKIETEALETYLPSTSI